MKVLCGYSKKIPRGAKDSQGDSLVGESPAVKEIAVKTRGRPLLVAKFDVDIQTYIKALRKAGTIVNVPVVLAVITARNRCALLKYGGHIELGRPWAVSILR